MSTFNQSLKTQSKHFASTCRGFFFFSCRWNLFCLSFCFFAAIHGCRLGFFIFSLFFFSSRRPTQSMNSIEVKLREISFNFRSCEGMARETIGQRRRTLFHLLKWLNVIVQVFREWEKFKAKNELLEAGNVFLDSRPSLRLQLMSSPHDAFDSMQLSTIN